ncbi:MAG: hypothetical protein K0Q95_249 [Bacteroidota bacterium]|jgi:hypothetical protein|nr:hypothetical protein [Bacteroidota bacterium]
MRKNYFAVILLCFGLTSFSYSQNSLKGSVTDSTGHPVPYCPMALLNVSDSTQAKGNLSDSAGQFLFENIKPGSYFIKFNAVGYRPRMSNTFILDSATHISLPAQVLGSSSVNLKEISIAEYKPVIEFKKGTVVMNVENDILTRGNTVLDLLKRLPGVQIDAQNNITINGASGARFLIDDRMQQMPSPQVMDMLAAMSADAVSKIELIKNPPARYDAAGTGGLINIVTKKAKVKGYNGSVGFGISMGKRLRVGPNGTFNYKGKKISVFSNLSYGYWNGISEKTMERNIMTGGNTETINSYATEQSFQRVFSAGGGIEYDVTKTMLLGLYLNGSFNNDHYTNVTGTVVENSTFLNYNRSNSKTNEKFNTSSPNINLSLLQKIDTTGGQIKLSLGYNNYSEREITNFNNQFYDASDLHVAPDATYDHHGKRSFNVFTGKLDLNKTFKNKFSVESGLSANIENDYENTRLVFTNQSTGFFTGDTTFYNIYDFRQNLLAGYTTLSRNWEKIGFSLGLRAENTDVTIKYISNQYIYKRNYLTLFPSASLDFKLNKKNSVTFAYSYRIRRPHYGMLNPVRQFNDQLSLTEGNPEIRPQFSHNFTVDYNFNEFITLSAGHDETKDFTFWYMYTPDSSRVNVETFTNLPRFTNSYISLSAQKRIKWYRFQTYMVVTRQAFEGKLIGQDVSSQTTQFYFNLNQEFYLPKDFKLQIWAGRGTAFRHGPQLYHPQGAIHISVNKTFLNQKLDLTFGLYDVLYSDYFSQTTTYSNQNFFMRDRWDSRRIRFVINYRFGKMQIQQRLNTERAAEIKTR